MRSLNLNAAQLKLFDGHRHLVARAVAKYGRLNDRDDIAQEARIGLVRAAQNYDASCGTPFGAYAWRCVSNRCLSFLRKPPQPISGDAIVGVDETGFPVSLFQKIEESGALDLGGPSWGESERDYKLNQMVDHGLRGLERRVVQQHFGLDRDTALTLDEIAKKVGLSRTTVHRALQKALAKLKKELEK